MQRSIQTFHTTRIHVTARDETTAHVHYNTVTDGHTFPIVTDSHLHEQTTIRHEDIRIYDACSFETALIYGTRHPPYDMNI